MAAKYYRDERAARRPPALISRSSQGVEEGYRLVGPGGALTPIISHVQWLDNHPDGPETHVMISFEDGTNVEFPFDVRLAAIWYNEQRAVSDTDLMEAAPAAWGAPAEPWR
ncbi:MULTISPECIES: hypothetical protein [unclassified Streptomyces]|uniref:hypothetical protein n=1 Tax=unclassified Streptomyces TaxID=2593676 RepID=UPI00224EAEC5|nr:MULTISPECIES: hypothetical protein [unclassified Streptomyces]MCX4792907.1 hypothetical protein [Streptomyces sp. NBC_01242]WSP59589.1 hypothetical protein OG306_38455 [Streptomyces sp. NBC_01241]WSP60814.1 hypothetical protein OG466_01980 [Streptomyces sp. NBC_01240]WSU19891.1 hypothetical protein OG508_01915 [Streptomyces sp. NBC_01108]